MSKKLDEGEYQRIVDSVVLPGWVHSFDHLNPELFLIAYDEKSEKFVINKAGNRPSYRKGKGNAKRVRKIGKKVGEYDTLVEAYDSLERGSKPIIDPSVDGHGGRFEGGFFFTDFDDDSFGRLLMDYGEDVYYSVVAYDYHWWINEVAPRYHSNPDDWGLAHNFINFHPAFWRRPDFRYRAGAEEDGLVNAYDWLTGMGAKWVNVDVKVSKKGKKAVYLETGNHVAEDDYRTRYADYNLMVKDSSLEGAFVKLAKQVAKFFNDDGTPKDVPKSEDKNYFDYKPKNGKKRDESGKKK